MITFRPEVSASSGRAYDVHRREMLFALGAGMIGAALFRAKPVSGQGSPFLLRPPGARENNPDPVELTRCTRCTACIRVCPTGGLQPAVFEAGPGGFATPVLVPRLGYCDFACTACGQVCPTQAIPPLELEAKRQKLIGTAAIDEKRCIAWAEHKPCIVCEEMCPLPHKAIRLETRRVNGPDGSLTTLDLPHVLEDSCIGCGICEYKCPVSGEAAIRITVSNPSNPI